MSSEHIHDPLQPHRHDPNFTPPAGEPAFIFSSPDGKEHLIEMTELQELPRTSVSNCYIVSTGHGTSGPFVFTGVSLLDFLQAYLPPNLSWSQVEVVSADGFGNRIFAEELYHPDPAGAILLSDEIDGKPMRREEGLVRMIVPSEKDDALRQVKWVGRVTVR